MDNQRILNAAIMGGLVGALLFSVPIINIINCFCCIGIMLGGAVGLFYYDRSFEIREFISPATAITVGLASGIAGAFIALFIDLLIYLMFGNWELKFLQQIIETLEEVPEMTEMFDEMLYELEQEARLGMHFGRILMGLVRNLILLPIFSMVGALVFRVFINKGRQIEESQG